MLGCHEDIAFPVPRGDLRWEVLSLWAFCRPNLSVCLSCLSSGDTLHWTVSNGLQASCVASGPLPNWLFKRGRRNRNRANLEIQTKCLNTQRLTTVQVTMHRSPCMRFDDLEFLWPRSYSPVNLEKQISFALSYLKIEKSLLEQCLASVSCSVFACRAPSTSLEERTSFPEAPAPTFAFLALITGDPEFLKSPQMEASSVRWEWLYFTFLWGLTHYSC